MSGWLRKVTADPTDLAPLVDALAHFDKEHEDGLRDLNMTDKLIWAESKKLPSLMAWRYAQYREIESIFDFLELQIRKMVKDHMQTLFKSYNKALSDRLAEKWAEVEQDVVDLRCIQIEFKLMMEKFAGLTKGMEYLHFQIGNLVKLREAGMEDARF